MSITEIIRRRRAIYPKNYLPDHPVTRQTLELLLENANWAPTHRLTEPWRFQVFHTPESRARLGDYLADFYQKNTLPERFSAEKMKNTAEKPRRSGAVLAICMQRDPAESVPEFEEIAAVAMAVQNMWLTCAELNLGCYWSTPAAALQGSVFFDLAPGTRCLGLFYLGWHALPTLSGKRRPVAEKTIWM